MWLAAGFFICVLKTLILVQRFWYVVALLQVKFPRTISNEAKDMLGGLLVKDPNKRLGGGPDDAKEIMAHPFFSSINWTDLQQKKVIICS